MYFKNGNPSDIMSPKKLEDCGSLFYIINGLFIAVILGYLIYNKDK